jgi:3-dehydroquinate synthase
MRKLTINGKYRDSTLLIGECLKNAGNYIPDDRVIIITDTHVDRLYREQFPSGDVITIGTGEGVKNLDTVRDIYNRLVGLHADRSTFVVGIGGGVVCDICGFVASTYMRGLRFACVPTTLLAQVDASVGGKNGVNLEGYKNLIGVFNQPEFVLCDGGLLNTLPEREILCGLAEIVKHAAIADNDLFDYLEKNWENAIQLDEDIIEKLIYDSVIIKSDIVNRDETEKGERRKLNFGHTFGHAIEKCTDCNHGEAISIGMVMACDFSVEKGLLEGASVLRLKRLLEKFELPTSVKVSPDKVHDAIHKDKKRARDMLHFVFLNRIGNAVVNETPIDIIQSYAGSWLQANPIDD